MPECAEANRVIEAMSDAKNGQAKIDGMLAAPSPRSTHKRLGKALDYCGMGRDEIAALHKDAFH